MAVSHHIVRFGQVIRATFSCNLPHNKYCVASCDCLCVVLSPPRATNFHVAESIRCFYFLQHENLLRAKVIRVTNNRDVLCNVCCAVQLARKCCPYYLVLSKLGSGDILSCCIRFVGHINRNKLNRTFTKGIDVEIIETAVSRFLQSKNG